MNEYSYRRPTILDSISLDRHAVIEADAGTGKTYTIQHLVLEMLLSTNCTIEQILVVTFTEKATAELRMRIRGLIEQLHSDSAVGAAGLNTNAGSELRQFDEDGRRKLEAALFSFDRAPIYTIHGFCQRVLSEFAFHSGTSFDLEVVEGRGAFYRAFRAELREHLSADELLKDWLGAGKSIDSLEDLLWQAHRYGYLESGEASANQAAIESLAKGFDLAPLENALSLLRKTARDKAMPSVGQLKQALAASLGDPRKLIEEICSIDFVPLLETAEQIKRNASEEALRQLETVVIAARAASRSIRIADSFLPVITQRLNRDKRERGELDYQDMLQWVWDALEAPGGEALAAALRARWTYAVVDEFQDTDDLQWRIFERVFVESDSGNWLYVVGDPKQAIYSFRGADVYTYLRARTELKDRGASVVPLTANFRSTQSFIEASNLILKQDVANPILPGQSGYESPALCGKPNLRALDARGGPLKPVVLLEYDPADQKGSAAEMRGLIGRAIAERVRRILSDDSYRIIIEDDGKQRAVSAGGLYILTRSNSESEEIGGYLRAARVPFAFYKREGLFQTNEAYEIRDVLQAIENPGSQSRRLKAWVSPFFAVPFERLATGMESVPAGHPLNEMLFEWRRLAEAERFADLFNRLIHDTGLINRELFLGASERRLTNYLHIFELLLHLAIAKRLSLAEMVSLLNAYITETDSPPGSNGNIERIEGDRDAVQVMTVHMSKGLQADVVFLFGGMSRSSKPPEVAVYHEKYGDNHERRLAIGKVSRTLASTALQEEERVEAGRLLYVALTRARARVYLPVHLGAPRKPYGYYIALNDRLRVIRDERNGQQDDPLFEFDSIADSPADLVDPESLAAKLKTWSPPEALLRDTEAISGSEFDRLRHDHAAFDTCSYTTLRGNRAEHDNLEPDEFKRDFESPSSEDDLRGGRRVGIFLHEAIEQLDRKVLAQAKGLEAWRADPGVRKLFADLMRPHQVRDIRWADRGPEIVFNTLRAPITVKGRALGPLCERKSVSEMGFVFPIPEHAHPLLGAANQDRWTVSRGYLKGFVDLVFEHGGLTYFADWKSDLLESYDQAAIERHVRQAYELQAQIYSVGVVRLLQIHSQDDYEQRFGGLLYLFLRGIELSGKGDEGIYFHRPAWAEIIRYEADLMSVVARWGVA
ncbi:MAG: UvrD-helicase domain-containing protein [Candidatus Binataceae bacterium]|nr:UvrD-helicase domain-containing protein [Candidatus Binataceae bacterium]